MRQSTDQIRKLMIEDHISAPYYSDAENDEWMATFWSEQSVFRRAFSQLDLSKTLELACGQGRHSAKASAEIGALTLLDVNATNIAVCRKRFVARPNTTFIVNDGRTLRGVESSSLTAVFSYDAMVHFEASDVISYISEISRVLAKGGRALLHYSNNEIPGINPFDDPSWRNYFSRSMMVHFASRSGLATLSDITMSWGGRPDLDGLVLLEKTDEPDADPVKTTGMVSRMASSIVTRLIR